MNPIILMNKIHLLQKELNPFLIKFVFSENRTEIEFGNSIYWTDFGTGNHIRAYFCNPEIESILKTNQIYPNQLIKISEKGFVFDILLDNMC